MHIAAAVWLAAIGCSGGDNTSDTPNVAASDTATVVAPADTVGTLRQLLAFGRSFGDTRATLRANLGAPVRETSEPVPNRHGFGTDSIFELEFDGLSFRLRQPANSSNELMESAELTDPQRQLPGDLAIGETRLADLRERFASPHAETVRGDTVQVTHIATSQAAEEYVRFDFVDGVLRRVGWMFYVD